METQIREGMFENYWGNTNPDGTFKDGSIIGFETRYKRGKEHPNYIHGKSRGHHTYRKDLNVKQGEVVHHIDGDFKNNSPKNIKIFKNHSQHMKYHWKIHKEKKFTGRMVKHDGNE